MITSSKRQTARLVQSEVSKHTGRPMTNKAARKWLKKSKRYRSTVGLRCLTDAVGDHFYGRPKFRWPTVVEMGTSFMGLARWVRFPESDPVPFGMKEIAMPGTKEHVRLPYWLYGLICAKNWIKTAPMKVALWCLGLRRVEA